MTIYNANDQIIGYYKESWKDSLFKIKGMLYQSDGTEWISVASAASLYSLHLKTVDGKKVASFQEGWMPLDWAKRFEMNTPIITFSSMVDERRGKWCLVFSRLYCIIVIIEQRIENRFLV